MSENKKCTECGCPVVDHADESFEYKGCLYCYDCMDKLFACCKWCEDYHLKTEMSCRDLSYYCQKCVPPPPPPSAQTTTLEAAGNAVGQEAIDRAIIEHRRTSAEEDHGKADARAWLYTVLLRNIGQIPKVKTCADTKFARTRARWFNFALSDLQAEMEERLTRAEKSVTYHQARRQQ